ncbi:hypothetical protein KZZ52_33855 [Dactylosporangium sp. AC04546]|uniref:WXG100-like domain-containing protein n=1 Tax=Dactylosporangium sp. AC04546 TaxID=2862460 RepID=UPI001EDDCA40|nr:hypothetical protein [Dactylosporangium sp. AC04546]WVK78961.1 hypothetical protein KZZ52_33855 [Dactylosporangium sp. AC04546]
MGLQLPGELVTILGMLGYDWPTSDEEELFYLGQLWLEFGPQLEASGAAALSSASGVWNSSSGDPIEAFRGWWNHGDSPFTAIQDGSTGATIAGAGLMVCAGIVLALKISVIVQLVILAIQIAQAIATAVATFGASLLEIPIFKMITSFIIDQLIDMAIQAVLNG